tara:strand:+ start:187 stop:1434 length:1248 start_codon:yes stop_codon:yes gene_type:complete
MRPVIEVDPVRRQVVEEMHLRPSPSVEAPTAIVQLLLLQTQGDTETLVRRLGGDEQSGRATRHGKFTREGMDFLWERHSEACTFTVVTRKTGVDALYRHFLPLIEPIPGQVLRAIKIAVENDSVRIRRLQQDWQLNRPETVAGQIGSLYFWSNFRLNEEDGFGQILISPGSMGPNETGRTIQQLQELGNYRNLALLSLPLVRERESELATLETRASAIINQLAGPTDDLGILDELIILAGEVAHLRDGISFRLSATRAYGQVASDRLASLGASTLDDFQSLTEFTNRRLLPALRTCENFTARIGDLAMRIEQATGLLRARIETRLNVQSGELLRSLGKTASHQLRLQHLVEGLSVFAVGYYALGLIGYLLAGVPIAWIGPHKTFQAYLVIPILILIALFLHRQRRKDPEDSEPGV